MCMREKAVAFFFCLFLCPVYQCFADGIHMTAHLLFTLLLYVLPLYCFITLDCNFSKISITAHPKVGIPLFTKSNLAIFLR